MAPFTILLISHWSRVLSEIFLHYHNSQPFSFPKWYDTWKLGQNWGCYEGKHFAYALKCKNFRGLFGALKLKSFSKKRYFCVTLDRHYQFLRSKSKSKKLVRHLLFSCSSSKIKLDMTNRVHLHNECCIYKGWKNNKCRINFLDFDFDLKN